MEFATLVIRSLVCFAMVVAACGGVPQAEHDRVVNELILAQQDLIDAQNDRAAAREAAAVAVAEASDAEDRARDSERALEETNARIDVAVASTGLIVSNLEEPLDLLAQALVDMQQENARLGEQLEVAQVEQPAVALDRFDAFLEVAATVTDFLRSSETPDYEMALTLEAPVGRAADEMLTLAFEQLVDEYETADVSRRRELLADVAMWAIGMMQSAVAGAP